MEKDVIQKVKFSSLDINDPFFESLRLDYQPYFEDWFLKKKNEDAYIFKNNGELGGFLYLKDENEDDKSVSPPLSKKRRLKIGTFKIDSHGTVLGQRFINIILSRMIEDGFSEVYVTLFEKQAGLIKLFEKFGFELHGKKENGEFVYLKTTQVTGNIYTDFPRIDCNSKRKFLLSIKPEFHTKMFPNSKLITETNHLIEDLSFTNTIEKIYITKMSGVAQIQSNDLIVIYRTKDAHALSAEYSSVATSICTVVSTKHMDQFKNVEDYLKYCGKGSIFSEKELRGYFKSRNYPYIIKMLYNFPLPKRVIRQNLINQVGLNRNDYFGFLSLSDVQFEKILEKGEISESFIIN